MFTEHNMSYECECSGHGCSEIHTTTNIFEKSANSHVSVVLGFIYCYNFMDTYSNFWYNYSYCEDSNHIVIFVNENV